MTGAVNYYDAYLCRWRSDVVQFQAAVREFSERTAEQFLRQDRLAQVLQAAEDCTPETHEERWRAVYECLGWNPDTARERYLERRAGK